MTAVFLYLAAVLAALVLWGLIVTAPPPDPPASEAEAALRLDAEAEAAVRRLLAEAGVSR